MSKVTISVEVPKELNELCVALRELIKDVAAKKDLAVVAAENLPNLAAAVQGLDQLAVEFKEDRAAFARAVGLLISDTVMELV